MLNGTEVDCGVQTKFPGANATATAQGMTSTLGVAGFATKSGKVTSPTCEQ